MIGSVFQEGRPHIRFVWGGSGGDGGVMDLVSLETSWIATLRCRESLVEVEEPGSLAN